MRRTAACTGPILRHLEGIVAIVMLLVICPARLLALELPLVSHMTIGTRTAIVTNCILMLMIRMQLRPSLAIPPLRRCRGVVVVLLCCRRPRSISVICCRIGALPLLLLTTAGSHAGAPRLPLGH